MSKVCQIDIGFEFLADILRLPLGVSIVGVVPRYDGHWPAQTARLVLEGDGLPDDCMVPHGGLIPIKIPQITRHDEIESMPKLTWDWR